MVIESRRIEIEMRGASRGINSPMVPLYTYWPQCSSVRTAWEERVKAAKYATTTDCYQPAPRVQSQLPYGSNSRVRRKSPETVLILQSTVVMGVLR